MAYFSFNSVLIIIGDIMIDLAIFRPIQINTCATIPNRFEIIYSPILSNREVMRIFCIHAIGIVIQGILPDRVVPRVVELDAMVVIKTDVVPVQQCLVRLDERHACGAVIDCIIPEHAVRRVIQPNADGRVVDRAVIDPVMLSRVNDLDPDAVLGVNDLIIE